LIRQKITLSKVAVMASVMREHVSRTVNDWIQRMLVGRVIGHYCIENKEKLERAAEV